MKKTKTLYWIFTSLFAAFMLFTAIPDVIMVQEAVTFMNHLGYPNYFIPFIGVAKVLGSIAILIPGFPRIKEWAYAGLFFDLIGATNLLADFNRRFGTTDKFYAPAFCVVCYFLSAISQKTKN